MSYTVTRNIPNKYTVIASPNKYTVSAMPNIYTCERIYLPSFWDKWNPYFDFLWTGLVSYAGPDYLISSFPDRRKITITGRDFSGTYIPDSSVATFKLVSDADFITDDSDNFWFTGGVQNTVTFHNLIDQDYTRTVIKFANTSPYDITAIGLMRSGITITSDQINELHTDFLLWLFWTGILNDYGYLKDNRLLP